MKKLRLTPLNIIAALSLALLVSTFFQSARVGHLDMRIYHRFLWGAMAVVSFITDLIFRFTLKDLKKIWIVELVFIAITVILMLILQNPA